MSERAPIWFGEPDLEYAQKASAGTLSEAMGIRFTEAGANFIRGTMPVTKSVTQPAGLLHGGASVVLAETLGSVGATLAVDRQRFFCVGQEINANHLQSAYAGDVLTGTATAIHVGARSHVWGIEIRDQRNRLTCVSRLTLAILPRRNV